MKCLLKLLAIGVLGVLLLVGAALFGIESVLTEALRGAVGHVTAQETALDGVELKYSEWGVSFSGLAVANPPGFQDVPLLKIGQIRASMGTQRFDGKVIVVDEIVLDGFELALELKGSDSNVHALMKRLAELQGTDPAAEPGEQAPTETPSTQAPDATAGDSPYGEQGAEPEVHINRVQVSGLKASLRISDVPGISGVYSVTVPDMVLENLDSQMREAQLSDWIAVILESVLQRALDAGQDVFPGEWQAIFKSELASALMKGDLQGASKELEQQADAELEKLKGQADEAEQKLLKEGADTLKQVGFPKDALQGELRKGADLRKDFFKD